MDIYWLVGLCIAVRERATNSNLLLTYADRVKSGLCQSRVARLTADGLGTLGALNGQGPPKKPFD